MWSTIYLDIYGTGFILPIPNLHKIEVLWQKKIKGKQSWSVPWRTVQCHSREHLLASHNESKGLRISSTSGSRPRCRYKTPLISSTTSQTLDVSVPHVNEVSRGQPSMLPHCPKRHRAVRVPNACSRSRPSSARRATEMLPAGMCHLRSSRSSPRCRQWLYGAIDHC